MIRDKDTMVAQVFTITYPKGGGYSTITKGDTTIDFYEGKITKADGSVEDLGTNLRNSYGGNEKIRSIFIEADQVVQVSFDDSGTNYYQIAAGDFLSLTYQSLLRINIKATISTRIAVWGCNDPNSVMRKLKSDIGGMSGLYQLRSSVDCTAGANIDTAVGYNFEIAAIQVQFSGTMSGVIYIYRLSSAGDSYKNVMHATTMTVSQSYYHEFARGQGRTYAGDNIRLALPAVAVTAYYEILLQQI